MILVLLFVVSLPAVTVRFYAADEIEYFAYLRSMWFDGDLSFDNEYRYFYDRGIARGWRFKETFLDGETATGLRNNFAPIGSAILWAPFYAAADAGVIIARLIGSNVARDGFSKPYIAAVVYASALYGVLALLMSVYAGSQILQSLAGLRQEYAVEAAAVTWLGTPLLFYMYLAPGFSHAVSAFAVAAFVVVWLHVRRNWSLGGIAALGVMAALMGMVREQDLFIAAGPALDYLVYAVRAFRDRRRPASVLLAGACIGLATSAVCFLPQIWTYQVLYGRPTPSPTVEQKMTWTSPHAWQVVASPENGLLFWTPLALAAIAGLVWVGWRSWVAFICVLMALTQIYVGGSLDTWAAAGSFGQRRLIGLTVFFVIGLTALLGTVGRSALALPVRLFVALAIWWNFGLMAQFAIGLMSRQHLDPPRNAYHAFVTIPKQLPSLVYRYLFQRSSFYQQRSSSLPL